MQQAGLDKLLAQFDLRHLDHQADGAPALTFTMQALAGGGRVMVCA